MKKCLASLALLATAATLPGTVSAATHPVLKPGTFKPVFLVGPKHNIPAYHTPSAICLNGTAAIRPDGQKNHLHADRRRSVQDQCDEQNHAPDHPDQDGLRQDQWQHDVRSDDAGRVQGANSSPELPQISIVRQAGRAHRLQQGGTDLGNTQYEDAFQRGTWWGNDVSTNTNYHVIYKTKIEPEQTIKVTAAEGSVINNPFGSGKVGTFGPAFGVFDPILQGYMKALTDVNPASCPSSSLTTST